MNSEQRTQAQAAIDQLKERWAKESQAQQLKDKAARTLEESWKACAERIAQGFEEIGALLKENGIPFAHSAENNAPNSSATWFVVGDESVPEAHVRITLDRDNNGVVIYKIEPALVKTTIDFNPRVPAEVTPGQVVHLIANVISAAKISRPT